MSRKTVCGAAFLAVGLVAVASNTVYETEMDDVLARFRSGSYSERTAATNGIEQAKANASSPEERATCDILLAYLLLDCAASELDASAYDMATNACASAKKEMHGRTDSWQSFGADTAMACAFVTHDRFAEAFDLCTNVLAQADAATAIGVDTNVWDALSKYLYCGERLPFRESLSLNAAGCLYMRDGESANLSPYTNRLSEVGLRLMRGLAPANSIAADILQIGETNK